MYVYIDCLLHKIIMGSFLENPAVADEIDASGLSEKDAAGSKDISPLAELYYPFLCAIVSSAVMLYCETRIIHTIYKTKSLHNWHYFFVANLMVCDIVFVLSTLLPGATISLYAMVNPDFKGVSCKIMNSITFPHLASFFMLVAIATDNMLKISFPFKYKQTMGTKLAVAFVAGAWLLSLIFFIPVVTGEDTERTKSCFCKWDDEVRTYTYGIPITLSVVTSVPLCAYLYYAVLKSWRDIRECYDPAKKTKLRLTLEGLMANRKLATNLFLLSIVPLIFGFLYPTLKSLCVAIGGEEFAESPYLVYVVLPYIGVASMILRSVLFGFRLHSQVKVWSCKCLH